MEDRGLDDEIDRIDEERNLSKRALLLAGGVEPYGSLIEYLSGGSLEHLEPSQRGKIMRKVPDYFMLDGKLRKRFTGSQSKQYVPPSEIDMVLNHCHGSATVGHLGILGTYRLINAEYFWRGQYEVVKRIVSTCDTCQRFQKKESGI
ncbi:hypothetical protein BGX20_007583, partial [Mortierella sp. AD010]